MVDVVDAVDAVEGLRAVDGRLFTTVDNRVVASTVVDCDSHGDSRPSPAAWPSLDARDGAACAALVLQDALQC